MIMIKKWFFCYFFHMGGGGVIANSLSSKIMYHKRSLSVKWFQNGFKIVVDLFGEPVWKECLHLKVVCIFEKVPAKGLQEVTFSSDTLTSNQN